MNAAHNLEIITVIGDAVLRDFITAGLSGRAGLAVNAGHSLREAAGAAAKSGAAIVLLFDSPPEAKEAWFRTALRENPRILPLLIAGEGTGRPGMLAEQNVLGLPLRLGALVDRIMRHGAVSLISSAAFPLGSFLVSPGNGTLTDKQSGKVVKLTEKERDILLKLNGRRGHTVDRRELLDDIWGYAEGIETHTLETHIYRLRQKIERDPARPEWLLTDEAGYKLAF